MEYIQRPRLDVAGALQSPCSALNSVKRLNCSSKLTGEELGFLDTFVAAAAAAAVVIVIPGGSRLISGGSA